MLPSSTEERRNSEDTRDLHVEGGRLAPGRSGGLAWVGRVRRWIPAQLTHDTKLDRVSGNECAE